MRKTSLSRVGDWDGESQKGANDLATFCYPSNSAKSLHPMTLITKRKKKYKRIIPASVHVVKDIFECLEADMFQFIHGARVMQVPRTREQLKQHR